MVEIFSKTQALDQINFGEIISNQTFAGFSLTLKSILKGDNLTVFNLLASHYEKFDTLANQGNSIDNTVASFLQFYDCKVNDNLENTINLGSTNYKIALSLLSKIKPN